MNIESSVPVLMKSFTDFCAVTAVKMILAQIPEKEQNELKLALVDSWKSDTLKMFDIQLLNLKDQVKQVPAENRLSASMHIDEIQKAFEKDLKSTTQTVYHLLGIGQENNK